MSRVLFISPTSLYLSFFVLTVSCPGLAADAIFEEEITVTATGREIAVPDVPAPVTVVTREEMRDAQTGSVAEMLRRVPGLTVMRSGGGGSVTSVFTRGTESDHTLVLFDGVRLNSPYFAGYDWSLASTAGLERVEVARGPYSALWGADAIGGVINMIPRRGLGGLEGELFLEGGESAWRRYQGEIRYAENQVDVYASGIYREGRDELPNSDFETEELLVDLGWSWGRDSRLALLVQEVDAETGIPLVGATVTPDRRQAAKQRLVAIPLKWKVDGSWTVHLNTSILNRGFSFADPDDAFGFTSSETSAETISARLANHHTLGRHILSWGGEWREDEVNDESVFGVNLDGETTEIASLFVQDQWRMGKRLQLIFGARWDGTEEWGSQVSPRINIGWRATTGLDVRFGYGEAFRQPSVGELHFPFSGNPELEAETSRSLELGFSYLPTSSSTRWQLNFFATELDNLIDFDYLSYRFSNTDSAQIGGGELAVDTPLGERLAGSFQLTYLHTEDDEGQRLLRRPQWSATASCNGTLWANLSGDVSVLWVGERDDVDPVTFARTRANSFVTVSLALTYRLWSVVELTLRVTNLADREYQEIMGYPAPGRRFVGGMRFTL